MVLDVPTLLVALSGVFVIAFMKGAFGGGLAILGIPLLSLVMNPLEAGALLAPLFILMDMVALRYWKPSTWSKPDLTPLLPSLIFGIGLGYQLLSVLDGRAVAIAMAVITLLFALQWFFGSGAVTAHERSVAKAVGAGVASGVTTMVAHAGGPPLAIYLLPRGLSKELYAGTTSIFFTVGNLVKVVPWLLLVSLTPPILTVMVVSAFVAPLGVWTGWKLHERLDQQQLYRVCYSLLIVIALKLLWDGVSGYL